MFGHLKAEDFTNLMEGAPLSNRQRTHLESCARCAATLKATEEIRNHVSEMRFAEDDHIPEPDWSEFRGDIRNALLSRSVRRQHTSRSVFAALRWKPAAALGFSMLLIFGVTAGVVFWNPGNDTERTTEVVSIQESPEAATMKAIAGMGGSDVFDDVLRLDADEAQSLARMLDDLTKRAGPQ